MVCQARSALRGYSRAAGLLLIDRRPLGTSLSLLEYADWVRQQPLLAVPDTPSGPQCKPSPARPCESSCGLGARLGAAAGRAL